MPKKLIAISPLWNPENHRVGMRRTYLDAIRECGAIPLVLPLHSEPEDVCQLLDLCQGLLLSGGPDIHPSLYGEEVRPACGSICPDRDRLERILYDYAEQRDMPLLGICRGIQTVNVFAGGTLYQDIPTETNSLLTHNGEEPYDRVMHQADLSGPIAALLGESRIGVNSIHHQAIKALAPALEAMAVSDDGLIEAVYAPGRSFLWAFQWHPEFSFYADERSRKIIQAFINAC